MAHTMTEARWVTTEDEIREIMALWPDIVRDLTNAGRYFDMFDVNEWMAKVLQYNVPGGKKNRTLAVVNAYRMLASPEQLTSENVRLARILGWCIEMFHAYFLIIDDIQDRSLKRRNKPCWYLQNDIGLVAVNDAMMLEYAAWMLLRTHLKGKDCYLEILELFQELIMKVIIGQYLDLLSSNLGKSVNLDLFTMDRYNAIVKYKCGGFAFLLPVRIAMYLAGIRDPEVHMEVKTILQDMGIFFQVQDDFLDVYGDQEVIGKSGTDIQEGKCTWLIVVALERATPEQRKILDACYGSKDPEKVNQVKSLYNDMGLSDAYAIYEEETYNQFKTNIQKLSHGLPHDLFLKLFEMIHRRVV